jgi:hypothetical protein
MTAIDFPNNPEIGEQYIVDSRAWVWTGITWDARVSEFYGNLDGGKANSVYGGISPIVGGSAVLV